MKTLSEFILKVEEKTGTKLQKVSGHDIVSQKSGFVADESENIIGLNLDSAKLTDISFLKNLTRLEQLILKGNQINDIGPLKNLGNLTYLNLEDNQISDASSTLNFPRNLTHLFLRRNSISDISFLEHLGSLRVLDLSENEISDVSAIEGLQHLSRLDLDFNDITILPKEIADLENLKHLSIIENPLEIPPCRYANDGLECIRDYFKKYPGNNLPPGFTETDVNKKDVQEKAPKVKRKKIFISYSHSDTEWLTRVQKHLRVLKNDIDDIDVWDDTRIRAGMKWEKEIEKALSESKIAVLLISTDFLASDFIIKNELPPLLKAAEEDGAVILPLIIMPSRFTKNKNLSQFHAVNDPEKKSLITLDKGEQEQILVKLANTIEDILSTDKPGDE